MQADRLNHIYYCWGLDLDGQGDTAEGPGSDANAIHGFVDCILAVVAHLQCRGAHDASAACAWRCRVKAWPSSCSLQE